MEPTSRSTKAVEQRYQKISKAARFIFILLVVIAGFLLFLPPWVLNLLQKPGKRRSDISSGDLTLFQQHGWAAAGIALLIILVVMLLFLVSFKWFSLRKKIKNNV